MLNLLKRNKTENETADTHVEQNNTESVKFSLIKKIALQVGLPCMALLFAVGYGVISLQHSGEKIKHLADHNIVEFVNKDINPLINEDMLPVINNDIKQVKAMEDSIRLLLEADRDVHQAVIAEKQALVASDEEEAKQADQTNAENIQQARDRIAKASEAFVSEKSKQLYTQFVDAFNDWEEKSRKVIELASTPGKLEFARKASDRGSAFKSFGIMREFIDQMQAEQDVAIVDIFAQLDVKRNRINDKKLKVEENTEDVLADVRKTEAEMKAQIGIFTGVSLACMVIALITSIFIGRSIIRPVKDTIVMLKDIATGEGDLTKRLEVKSKDEISLLAKYFNDFIGKLQTIIKEVASTTVALTDASGNLTSTATEMVEGVESINHQSTSVSGAAEQMKANMTNMANSSEAMSTNIRTVSSAVEEMTASIGEIAKNAEQAATVANQASSITKTSNADISQLGQAADAIGKVIEVIQDIAEQTNLLALNATIEAARAGDAGKGFAVVATEVKELAKQTADATEDIAKRIAAIQQTSNQAVSSIGEISNVIQSVTEVSRSIASAVEEQSITTKQISENVIQTANASEIVSTGVVQSATATEEITQNIAGISTVSQNTSKGAATTKDAAMHLSNMAEKLSSYVNQFKV